jgi:hypothetical protein
MDQVLKEKLMQLKFIDADMSGVMRAKLDGGIEVRAVSHPFHGLVLIGSHFDGRKATEFEVRLPETASIQEIAKSLLQIYQQVFKG